jgi:hypothetical protein
MLDKFSQSSNAHDKIVVHFGKDNNFKLEPPLSVY